MTIEKSDTDKIFTNDELEKFSEKELTVLSIKLNCKNALFFSSGIPIAYFSVTCLGVAGKIIAWGTIVLYSVGILEALAAFFGTMIAGIAKPNLWRLPQLGISLFTLLWYAGAALLVYAKIL